MCPRRVDGGGGSVMHMTVCEHMKEFVHEKKKTRGKNVSICRPLLTDEPRQRGAGSYVQDCVIF